MATINRIRFAWTGSAVTGGGVSTFYSEGGDVAVATAAIRAFYFSMAGLFPASLEIVAPAGGETLDAVSGAVNGVWSTTPPATVVGSGSTSHAKGVGMRVVFNTNAITRRRRIRGCTYLVPIVASAFDTDGTILPGNITGITTAAATLIAADGGSLRVYTRPRTKVSNDGATHAITSATVPDKVSWLRSRRT